LFANCSIATYCMQLFGVESLNPEHGREGCATSSRLVYCKGRCLLYCPHVACWGNIIETIFGFNFRFRFRMFFIRTVWKHPLSTRTITNLSCIFFESWVFSFSGNHNLKKKHSFVMTYTIAFSDFFRISSRIII